MDKFEEKLKATNHRELWDEYCGFLNMSLEDYMYVQDRLMREQIRRWCASGLGRTFLNGAMPITPEDFRRAMPMTAYEDYAEILLGKETELLPEDPVVWLQTTWEGGLHPIKTAPYTRAMLDTYRRNTIAIMMMASSAAAGSFDIRRGDRILYGGAPLPYLTGLLPTLLDEDIKFAWLPDNNSHSDLSFSQRIKAGFAAGLRGGIDYFFAIGSVANYITESFACSMVPGAKRHIGLSLALRYLRGKYICRRDGRRIQPKDLFRLKGMVATGTDAKCYKKALEDAWGVPPIEIAAGTESTCIAAETRDREGMVFFPDACYYEFIPESEMLRNLEDPDYVPRTCLMNQVEAAQNYELVISVLHGGAFMRYRIADIYRCVSAGGGELPRFTYVDRAPGIIDIAGFTRITEASITEVIRLSRLGIGDWFARKEFDSNNTPYLHLYLEIPPETLKNEVITRRILTEQLAVYFRYFDSDYDDLKKLLGMEPLQITILKYGTMMEYQNRFGRLPAKINCPRLDLEDVLSMQDSRKAGGAQA